MIPFDDDTFDMASDDALATASKVAGSLLDAAAETAGDKAQTASPKIDLKALADELYALMLKELKLERQRLGQ